MQQLPTLAPQTAGTGIVGMPTLNGNGKSLYQELSSFPYASYGAVPSNALGDTFAWNVANLAASTFMTQPGNVSANGVTLGPVATGNITFQTGVTYHGLVTYTWDLTCESVTNEITYNVFTNVTDPTNSMITFTMPGEGGTCNSTLSVPYMYTYPNGTERAGLGFDEFLGEFVSVPYGGTLYFAGGAFKNVTGHYAESLTTNPD
jgi:hypothetical protein